MHISVFWYFTLVSGPLKFTAESGNVDAVQRALVSGIKADQRFDMTVSNDRGCL